MVTCLHRVVIQGRHVSRPQTPLFNRGAALTLKTPRGAGSWGRLVGHVRLQAHLIHGGVEGEELGVPVGAPCLLVLPLELLGADVPQQVLQAGVRLQAAQVEVGGGEGRPRGFLGESVDVSGPRLLGNNKMASCGLDTGVSRNA